MNLEQFKKQFESSAQKRSTQQEKTIMELHAKIARMAAEIKERDERIRIMENRCFATNHGVLCIFCGYKKTCKALHGREGGQP